MPAAPNVIFVITDDQGYGDIGCHGNPVLKTPNLDCMARESVQLDNHHHDPLCSPSRAALLTGQYAARNGVWHVIQGRHLLNPAAVTMADVFAAEGYRAAMFGKWHLGDNYPFAPQYRGFEETLCHRGGGIGELPDYWGNNYVDDVYFHNGEPTRCEGYCTDVFFDAALEFIDANKQAPFFIYLAPNAMHAPHIVPDRYAAPYLDQGIPEERAKFYGMIANFDENMGRLFARLKALHLDERTLVIFTADHGTAAGFDPATGAGFNAGLRGKKGSLYDGGHQVSFFMRWPRHLPTERNVSQLTAHIDILPTLIELCDLQSAPEIAFDGISLAGLTRGDVDELPERSIVVQLQPDQPRKWHQTAVLNGRWRLANETELYDVERDRAQAHDVAPDFPQVAAALRRDYDLFWNEMQDCFTQMVAIPVGATYENPALLSARDWHPTEGRVPWRQSWIDDPAYDATGFWWIDVAQPGHYHIELRTHPREADKPMNITSASLTLGDKAWTKDVSEALSHVTFEMELRAGATRLFTSLSDANAGRERGAYYTYVTKI
ncbi:MAG: arylsulfatase [Chloroflexota bacterium]|nr:arylsulfatase [Chloroflexota bacterium]MDE2909190.1 arylsulfatase [Chloroflexota bacterium]